tara:strand:- start:155 stop:304 length:150 start_codon:yes stop_codon:yes gene_type:complete
MREELQTLSGLGSSDAEGAEAAVSNGGSPCAPLRWSTEALKRAFMRAVA